MGFQESALTKPPRSSNISLIPYFFWMLRISIQTKQIYTIAGLAEMELKKMVIIAIFRILRSGNWSKGERTTQLHKVC